MILGVGYNKLVSGAWYNCSKEDTNKDNEKFPAVRSPARTRELHRTNIEQPTTKQNDLRGEKKDR
jgi:hypothetical protein